MSAGAYKETRFEVLKVSIGGGARLFLIRSNCMVILSTKGR